MELGEHTPLISIAIPVYNEEEVISELYRRTTTAISALTEDYEIICIDDGSTDTSIEKLLHYHQQNKRFKVASLSRNFGHQAALLAGLSLSTGQYVGMMDGDLQDPPELFEQFLGKLRDEKYNIAYAVRQKRKEAWFKRLAYWVYYRILGQLAYTKMPLDSGDFCMVDRQALDEILRMPEQSLFIRGIRSWVGFRQIAVPYERSERLAGTTKYSMRKLFQLAYDGIFSFSNVPIKFMRRLGYLTITGSLVYACKVLVSYLLYRTAPQGFTTLIIALIFFSGVQLISVGVLGEYIHRIYNESRHRPLFIIKDKYL